MSEIKGRYLPALLQQMPIYSYEYDSQSLFSLFQGIETPMPHKSILLPPRFSYQGNVADCMNKISEGNMWSTMHEVISSQTSRFLRLQN